MQLNLFLRSLRSIGLANSIRTLRFTLLRDRLDRRYKKTIKPRDPEVRSPGLAKWIRSNPHGAEVQFEQATLELLFLATDVIRISWKPGELPIPYAIVGNAWPGDQVQADQDPDGFTLTGSSLTVQISNLGEMTILDCEGKRLRRDDPPVLTGDRWEQTSPLDSEACIFGLGERACGWNLRGGRYQLWNQDPGGSYGHGHDPLYMSIPLYLCLQPQGSYLLLYENAHRGELAFDESARVRFERGALRSYFFFGSPEHCLERYTRLTGRPPMPPHWSLGYHQSRWGYQSQDKIQEIADQFKQHKLPISAIHLDIDYMDGYRIFTFDKHNFGNVLELSQSLQADDIKLVAIVDPGVKVDRNFALFNQGLSKGIFCTLPNGQPMRSVVWPGWAYFPDFTNPATRRWWGNAYPQLVEQGIAGFWHDKNEPMCFTPWGDMTFPILTQHDFESQGGDHLGAHNLYGLLMNRAGFEALQQYQSNQRPWLLSRAGYAGSQRYAWNWTGDIETSWEALRQTLVTMLGVSLSGFAYTGSDIGGFSGAPDAQLYLRWFQLGTFSPFFRTHSVIGAPPREPWVFGEQTLEAARELLEIRYRLLPYLYTLAWIAHKQGTPLMRPTFWSDPSNPSLWQISDQYFLGSDLLVAPVMTPDTHEREIHFPQEGWYGLWDDGFISDAGKKLVPAELNRIPVYVRGGAVLPMARDPMTLELHVFLPEAGPLDGQLYSDEGDGYQEYRVDSYEGTLAGKRLVLVRRRDGEYPWPYTRTFLVLHGGKIVSATSDGEQIESEPFRVQVPLFNQLEIELA
jgi:alpha-glucosidase